MSYHLTTSDLSRGEVCAARTGEASLNDDICEWSLVWLLSWVWCLRWKHLWAPEMKKDVTDRWLLLSCRSEVTWLQTGGETFPDGEQRRQADRCPPADPWYQVCRYLIDLNGHLIFLWEQFVYSLVDTVCWITSLMQKILKFSSIKLRSAPLMLKTVHRKLQVENVFY